MTPRKKPSAVRVSTCDATSRAMLLLSRFSRVRLCATPQTVAHQAPPSLGFSRQEHWSGLPFPSPVHERKSESEVAQSYLTPSDPMDCSPPGSSAVGFSRQEYWSGVPLPSHMPWVPSISRMSFSRCQGCVLEAAAGKPMLWCEEQPTGGKE